MQPPRRPRRQFTTADKARIAARGHELSASGLGLGASAAKLDVLESSLRLWMKQHPRVAPRLRRVRLVDPSSAAAVVAEPPASQASVITPDGFRIEGLSIDDAIAILERLR